jgi:hypothetical protein
MLALTTIQTLIAAGVALYAIPAFAVVLMTGLVGR